MKIASFLSEMGAWFYTDTHHHKLITRVVSLYVKTGRRFHQIERTCSNLEDDFTLHFAWVCFLLGSPRIWILANAIIVWIISPDMHKNNNELNRMHYEIVCRSLIMFLKWLITLCVDVIYVCIQRMGWGAKIFETGNINKLASEGKMEAKRNKIVRILLQSE